MSPPILEVSNLKKFYPIRGGVFHSKKGDVKAVQGVTFQLLKGPSWIIEEAWSMRVQAAFWATTGWRSSFTGFRCAAETDVGPAPSTTLPQRPVAQRGAGGERPGPPAASPSLTHNGERRVTLALEGLRGRIHLC